jgi:hypothetical protein
MFEDTDRGSECKRASGSPEEWRTIVSARPVAAGQCAEFLLARWASPAEVKVGLVAPNFSGLHDHLSAGGGWALTTGGIGEHKGTESVC